MNRRTEPVVARGMPRRSPHDTHRIGPAPLLAARSILCCSILACAVPDARDDAPPSPERTTIELTDDTIAVETVGDGRASIACGSREGFEFRAARDADGSWDPAFVPRVVPDATPGGANRRQWVTALQVIAHALDTTDADEAIVDAGCRYLIDLQRGDGAFLSDDLSDPVDIAAHGASVIALAQAHRRFDERPEFADAAAAGATFLLERELEGGGWAATDAGTDSGTVVDVRATAWAAFALRRACLGVFHGCEEAGKALDRANDALAASIDASDDAVELQRLAVARLVGSPGADEDVALTALVTCRAAGRPVDAEAVLFAFVIARDVQRSDSYRRGSELLRDLRATCFPPAEQRGRELYAGHAVTDGGAVGARALNAIALTIYFRSDDL